MLAKLLLALMSVLVALGLAEIGLRFCSPMQLGFEYKDGRFTHPQEFVPDDIRNSHGFHDVEHGPKRAGVRRVVLLGDSYVLSEATCISETPGQRLEYYLNAKSDQAYEVISIGKGGWGQADELAALRRHARWAQPDIVITLFLALNDLCDNSESLSRERRKWAREHPRFRPGTLSVEADDAPLFVFRWSVLNQLISHRLLSVLRDKTADAVPTDYMIYAEPEGQQWKKAWSDTAVLIRQTQAEVTDIGARYALVAASTSHGVWGAQEGLKRLMQAYPGMKTLQWDLDKPDARIESLCRNNGIPFLALEPLFRIEVAEKGRRLHLRYDNHWNAEGNDLAGRYIADFLLALDNPPEPPNP